MRKAKKLSNKLMATLLSASMVFAPVIQTMPVHAAEPVIEEESADTLSDNTEADEPVDDNNDADAPDADNGDSDNQGTENNDSGNPETEVGDIENPETPEADESLNEDILPDEILEDVGGRATGSTTSTISEMTAKGWNESIYAEISGIKAADVSEVSYSGETNGKLSEADLQYLVRDNGTGVRIDVLGLEKGKYSLTVTALSGSTETVDNITVYAYDRSGYAHFNYEGVGAYNDDGTLKDNAVILYVTDANKNDVELTVGKKTVKGIGNILNSAGKNDNNNSDIIKELATAGKPLVVRFIGTVSESGLYSKGEWSASDDGLIDGLTDFNSTKNGGGVGDNGHLARIRAGRDITLEGIGTDAVIDGWGFHYMTDGSGSDYGKSFEVRNLTFINTAEDAVGMEGKQEGNVISDAVERCWVHNNEFYCPHIIDPAEEDKAEGDGSVDFKRGEYFTCSYNYFEGCHKTNLVGAGSTVYQYNLTYHHNYYYKCGSRGPLSRNANIHMYNNVYEQQTDYAMDARASAYIFAEYNLFYAASSPHTTSREGGGTIKSYKDSFSSVLWNNGKGNIVDDKGTYVENNCQYAAAGIQYDRFDLDSTLSYIPNGDYDLQTDFMKMRAVLASQLGVQDENPIPVAEITPDNYSMVKKSGAVIKQIELPFNDAPGEISKTTYAFKVDVPFNVSVKYGATPGILVNDAGENLLEGDGGRVNLPAGRYMIQSTDFTPANTGCEIWNTCNIDSIKIEEYVQGSGDDKSYTITLDYNDDSSRVIELEAAENTKYENMSELVPSSFIKKDSKLEGLYTDADCTTKVEFPYTVTANVTLYAHWNILKKVTLSLDCSKDLDSATDGTETKDDKTYDTITIQKTINGFTLHVLPGTVGSTKYYMTLKNSDTDNVKVLYTNGVLIQADQDPMLKAIEFETSANSVLIVETALSGNPATSGNPTYKLVLAKDGAPAGSEQKHNITQGRTKVTETFEISEAGKYYLYPEGDKGLIYYSLKVIEQQYTIVYKPGLAAASGDFTSVVAKENEEITLPAYEAVEGYTFTGWSLDGTTPIDGDKYTVKSEDASADNVITITALYAETEYNIAYDPDGGNLPTEGLPQKGMAGQTLTLGNCTPANTKTHKFIGWSIGNSEPFMEYTIKSTDAVNGTITLKAVYKEILPPYTIKYEVGEGTLPPGKADTEPAYEGDDITLPVCIPPAEKKFLGWNKNGSSDYIETYTVNAADADPDGIIILTAAYGEDTSHEEGTSHKGIAIVGLEPAYEFTGAKIIPNIAVVDYDIKGDDGKNGKVLSQGVDYTVKYANNSKLTSVSKKDAIVTVTGKGNYAGKDTQATFKIVDPKPVDATLEDLKGAKLSKINPVEYTGVAQYPEIELKLKNGTLTKYTYDEEAGVYKIKEGTDKGTAIGAKVSLSNNINRGTATILLTGKNGTNGKPTTIKKTFKITAIDLSKAGNKLTVTADPATYSVKGAAPSKLTVHYKDDNIDKDLINGVDYTVKYSSNKKAGVKGKIAITGKGNYAKKYTEATYDIQALEWSAGDTGDKNPIKAVQVYAGLKAGKVKATVVDKDGNALKPAQYTLKVYTMNDDVCVECPASAELKAKDKIYVEATAKDTTNLSGTTAKAEFIVGNNIAKAKFVLKDNKGKAFTAQYTGAPIELKKEIELKKADLEVTIKEKGSNKLLTLEMGADYEIVSYSNNINKGTATAVIKGTGSYSGTKTVKFKIVGKKMEIGEGNINIPWKDIPSQFKNFMNGIFN